MPRGDGTGPKGLGPMTGRGLGFCAGFVAPGYVNPGPRASWGRGLGRGGGRGWGWCRPFGFVGAAGWVPAGYPDSGGANVSPEAEKEILSCQAEFLENQLERVRKRLQKLNEEQA